MHPWRNWIAQGTSIPLVVCSSPTGCTKLKRNTGLYLNWLEGSTHNGKVIGSSPLRPTKHIRESYAFKFKRCITSNRYTTSNIS